MVSIERIIACIPACTQCLPSAVNRYKEATYMQASQLQRLVSINIIICTCVPECMGHGLC